MFVNSTGGKVFWIGIIHEGGGNGIGLEIRVHVLQSKTLKSGNSAEVVK